MFVRQFLALVILYGAVMVDVEKIPGHLDKCVNLQEVPAFSPVPTDSVSAPTLFLIGRHP
jgi:hypothetical protein